ncbi:unnamed protein product [Brassicogethes aeneus]|uniref:DNA 3'-5' helicase n=1 Tax=Brassicogethes aeneus TaxID=1431903 RepID=A0A9P0BN45_BRAAE|nr:unnamed protein product [Brassicogethes aeneus]
MTGDSEYIDFGRLIRYDFIITTPEKWDLITRKWKDNVKLVQVIKLFLIDEVHLLNDKSRGPTLEVIVSRMKTIENAINAKEKIRIMAVSATVPNIEDVANWIGSKLNTCFYKFADDMRPVPLKKIVFGYAFDSKNGTHFKFDLSLNYRLQNLLIQYSNGKPTLIFCSTRKSVEMTAKHLVQNLTINLNDQQKKRLQEAAGTIQDVKAKNTIAHGVGYHHAGMLPETKHAIENLFRNSDLPVLVTTSTLAMGVNLPAHLVIVKSTKCYAQNGFEDYSETAIMQMIGRAGRPQFDTSGTAIILTTTQDRAKFEKMIGGSLPIESNLHKHLKEHLNAEVVLGTITDLEVAMRWLSSTFLYIRARKNPKHYGFSTAYTAEQIDKKLLELCQIQLNKLVNAGMLTIDQNITITPTNSGIVMAKYYIAFETMKLFTKISGCEVLQQILALISKCHEFSEMYLRTDDKKCLNLLNKNKNNKTIRFPLNGKIKTLDMKINCIIQACFGCLDIWDHSVLADSQKIMRNGGRIVNCLIEYLNIKPKCYSALLSSLILSKCFRAGIWENSPYVGKQLTGIGAVLSRQLANAGKTTFEKISSTNPRELEMILKKKSPFGNKIIDEIKHIPKYEMTLERNNNKTLTLSFGITNPQDLQTQVTGKDSSLMTLLVGDSNNEILLYEQYRHSYMLDNLKVVKQIHLENGDVETVSAHFLSEQWVGIDCNCTLDLTKGKLKASENEKSKGVSQQMYMDLYMKVKKNIPAKKEQNQQPKSTKTRKSEKAKILQRTVSQFLPPRAKSTKQVSTEDTIIEDSESMDKMINELCDAIIEENDKKAKPPIKKNAIQRTISSFMPSQPKKPEVPTVYEKEEDHLLELTKSKTESVKDVENKIKIYQNVLLKQPSQPKKKIKLFESADIFFESELFDDDFPEDQEQKKENLDDMLELNKDMLDGIINSARQDEKYKDDEAKISSTSQDKYQDLNLGEKDVDLENFLKQEFDIPIEVFERAEAKTAPNKVNFNTNVLKDVINKPVVYGSAGKNSVPCPPLKPLGINNNNVKNIKPKGLNTKLPLLHPALEFEDKLCNEENDSSAVNLQEYRYAPRKSKLSHLNANTSENTPDSTVNAGFGGSFSPAKRRKLGENNAPKCITWSSPLVFSPPTKFSPKIHKGFNDSRNQVDLNQSLKSETSTHSYLNHPRYKTWPKSTPKKSVASFPLGDKHYGNETPNTSTNSIIPDDISDICSQSFIENLGLKTKPQKTQNIPSASAYNSQIHVKSQLKKVESKKEEFVISQKALEFNPRSKEKSPLTQKSNFPPQSSKVDETTPQKAKSTPQVKEFTPQIVQSNEFTPQIVQCNEFTPQIPQILKIEPSQVVPSEDYPTMISNYRKMLDEMEEQYLRSTEMAKYQQRVVSQPQTMPNRNFYSQEMPVPPYLSLPYTQTSQNYNTYQAMAPNYYPVPPPIPQPFYTIPKETFNQSRTYSQNLNQSFTQNPNFNQSTTNFCQNKNNYGEDMNYSRSFNPNITQNLNPDVMVPPLSFNPGDRYMLNRFFYSLDQNNENPHQF